MGQLVRELAVFMILAELFIYMLPSGNYEKYLRFLIDLIIILILLEPLGSFFKDSQDGIITGLIRNYEDQMIRKEIELDSSILDFYQRGNDYDGVAQNGEKWSR